AGASAGPYSAWRALARALTARHRADGDGLPDPGGLFSEQPLSAEHVDESEQADLDAEGRKMRLFEATCKGMASLTRAPAMRDQPVVLFVDDLDGSDAGT